MVKRYNKKPFWDRMDRSGGPDACWPWQAAIRQNGYGAQWFRGGMRPASRVAYILARGDIPAEHVVRHTCDNPPCCNPAHLILGTHQDNTNDAIERGRFVRGEKSPNAKLSAADVNAIRDATGRGVGKALAARFGVATGTIYHIRNGTKRRHEPPPGPSEIEKLRG